ncbi:collagen alpha-1(I) chain-like isoform X1 [Accipiter gentilis]|uniref:collagen alpha-1(I) chain-like isoform X1 n=1 Tax=Astur gentilis TaxID=8957 RepID=UPI00210F2383|nr:collagen alpha-1(I) chain-like isoform X1 [Accipiter gentilis]XP_049653603.1 collagen alpha-1(I) chain-like isoform X1 [Accipiter gentilis]
MTFLRALEVLFPISASLRSTQRTEAWATVTNAFAIWRKEAVAAAWCPLGSAESTCSSSPTGKILLKAKSICTRRPREPPVGPGATPASLNSFPPQEELGRLLGVGRNTGSPRIPSGETPKSPWQLTARRDHGMATNAAPTAWALGPPSAPAFPAIRAPQNLLPLRLSQPMPPARTGAALPCSPGPPGTTSRGLHVAASSTPGSSASSGQPPTCLHRPASTGHRHAWPRRRFSAGCCPVGSRGLRGPPGPTMIPHTLQKPEEWGGPRHSGAASVHPWLPAHQGAAGTDQHRQHGHPCGGTPGQRCPHQPLRCCQQRSPWGHCRRPCSVRGDAPGRGPKALRLRPG